MAILEVEHINKTFRTDRSIERYQLFVGTWTGTFLDRFLGKWKDDTFALPELFRAPHTWTDYCK